MVKKPIGVFDSGYGGLTVLKQMVHELPGYDYLYLGDNARAPYGPRSFETVYEYTLQAVKWFFSQGCELVILACNTASAKALRTIQQNDLEKIGKSKRVLGVIRPTAEIIGQYSQTGHVGILGTKGTVQSGSYPLEIQKFYPELVVSQEACPIWVPLIENNEHLSEGAGFFIRKHIDALILKDQDIDTILLACTHYPLLEDKIREAAGAGKQIISQGNIVAQSLKDYLERHPEIESQCSKGGELVFYTTDSPEDFDQHSRSFFGTEVNSRHLSLNTAFFGK